MKLKKILSVCITLLLLTALLAGCGKETGSAGEENKTEIAVDGGKAKTAAMGRYVEQSLDLPQFAESESVLNLIQGKNGMILYTFAEKEGNMGTYSAYHRQADGAWDKSEAVWLNTLSKGKKLDLRNIRMGGEESIYAWYFDKEYLAHIVKTTDELTVEEIPIPDLTKKENIPSGFAVTGKSEIAIFYMSGSMSDSVVLYSAEEGSELRRFKAGSTSQDNNSSFIDASGNKLAVISEDRRGITVYDTDTGDILDELRSDKGDLEKTLGVMLGMIKIGIDDDYYYITPKGLNHFQSGGSIMETVIDGSLNTIGMEGIHYVSLLIGGEQDYTVLFADERDYELAHYVYDSNVPTLPEIQLAMYGLKENKSVSRAIGTYQRENPDVQISYYTAQTEGGAVTTADSIRALNTELLAGKGADILLLDGLPIESYIEKGVLADISDIVRPMSASGELLGNIIGSYEQAEKGIYGMPVRFVIPILVGEAQTNTAFQSLDSLRQYAKENIGKEFIGFSYRTIEYGELAGFIFDINYQEIVGDGTKLDQAKLVEFLETVQETGTAIGATVEAQPKAPTTKEELEKFLEKIEDRDLGAKFELGDYPLEDGNIMGSEIGGVMDMMVPVGIRTQFNKQITSANGLFIPSGIIGINSSSKQIEKAKDFLKCVLSEPEQNKDMGDGMPVNLNALANYCNKESDMMLGISGLAVNGEKITLTFEWPTKSEIADITDLAKTLTVPLNVDRVFKDMILEEATPFFEGSVTAEKAAETIMNKANTYLAE